MPGIISSALTINNLQIDGRRSIIETLIDDSGNQYQFSYMADPDMDLNAHLAADALNLTAELQTAAQQESS